MRKSLWVCGIVAAVVPGVAMADDFSSEPQVVAFRGGERVLDRRIDVPLTLDIIQGIIEDFGVVAHVNATSDLYISMEGESQLTWPDPSGAGDVRQTVRPLANGSSIALDSSVQVDVEFTMTVLGSQVGFSLWSYALNFRPEVSDFEPFLLPGQQPNQLRVSADPTSGQFVQDLGYTISFGPILSVRPGVVLTLSPNTFSTVRGLSLDTVVGEDTYRYSDPNFPASISIYENTGSVEMMSVYRVSTQTEIGYTLDLVGYVEVELLPGILGDLLSFDFDIPLYSTYLPLFTGNADATYETRPYVHPLPVAVAGVPSVDFGTINVGDARTFTVPLNNDGQLDLLATATLEGAGGVFEVAPVNLLAGPGGQDAVIITFRPDKEGDFDATLVFTTSDPTEPVLEIPVHGAGQEEEKGGGNGGGNDDDVYNDGGGTTTLYSGCGCASGGGAPGLALVALVAVSARRRRS
jgi:MYXO-CTERM domain-containing protein